MRLVHSSPIIRNEPNQNTHTTYMNKTEIKKFATLVRRNTQKDAMLNVLIAGYEPSADDAAAAGIRDPRRVVNFLREEGYPIYLNNRKTRSGDVVRRYRLGTPRRA